MQIWINEVWSSYWSIKQIIPNVIGNKVFALIIQVYDCVI